MSKAKKVAAKRVHKTSGPRAKVIMSKYAKRKVCPKCEKTRETERSFGFRMIKGSRDGKPVVFKRPQSWCRACRGKG